LRRMGATALEELLGRLLKREPCATAGRRCPFPQNRHTNFRCRGVRGAHLHDKTRGVGRPEGRRLSAAAACRPLTVTPRPGRALLGVD